MTNCTKGLENGVLIVMYFENYIQPISENLETDIVKKAYDRLRIAKSLSVRIDYRTRSLLSKEKMELIELDGLSDSEWKMYELIAASITNSLSCLIPDINCCKGMVLFDSLFQKSLSGRLEEDSFIEFRNWIKEELNEYCSCKVDNKYLVPFKLSVSLTDTISIWSIVAFYKFNKSNVNYENILGRIILCYFLWKRKITCSKIDSIRFETNKAEFSNNGKKYVISIVGDEYILTETYKDEYRFIEKIWMPFTTFKSEFQKKTAIYLILSCILEIDFFDKDYSIAVPQIVDEQCCMVKSNIERCSYKEHMVCDYTASIKTIICSDDGVEEEIVEKIPAGYCCQCEELYVLEEDYVGLRGVPVCNIYVEERKKRERVARKGWNIESGIHVLGYNVRSINGLSKSQRESVLSMIIKNQIYSREEVLSYLDKQINLNKSKERYKVAIQKWIEDRNYVLGIQENNNNITITEIKRVERK